MLKLILNNETELNVKDGSTLFDLMVEPDDYSIMWESLTAENLKVVKLVDEAGDMIDQLSNLVVDSENSRRVKGEVECHFYLREKNDIEKLQEKVEELMESSEVHDGAITDLAEAVSGLAEEGGLA